MNEWIKVEHSLPEPYGDGVLPIMTKHGIATGYYLTDRFCTSFHFDISTEIVTHWMRITPPKQ